LVESGIFQSPSLTVSAADTLFPSVQTTNRDSC
jgi:hypothetical protein